jgi:hypothetical protein
MDGKDRGFNKVYWDRGMVMPCPYNTTPIQVI